MSTGGGGRFPGPGRRPPAIPVAAKVEKLGTTKFQSAYGGQDRSPSGRLVIYVVAAQGDAFLPAVRDEAARSPQADYNVAYVPHSWAQLNALTIQIARDRARWRERGIELARWGPDAASSKVVITLRSYTAAAERELLAGYGPDWVSVSPTSRKQRHVFMSC